MSAVDLAEWSNAAVYASMVALTFSMIAFAATFSARGNRVDASVRRTPVAVGAGSPQGPADDMAIRVFLSDISLRIAAANSRSLRTSAEPPPPRISV